MSSPSAPIVSNVPRARDATLEFYWYPPASSGDSAISSYTLACTNPVVGPFSYPVGTNQALVTGLTNGTFYPFTTYATNVNGNTGPSAGFRAFAPGSSVPNQPLSTMASVIGTNSAIVSWNPPSVLPDSPINWYVIQSKSTNPADPIQKVTADGLTQQSYLLTGLNSNSGYQFSVQSVNCPGYSPAVFTSSIAWGVVPGYVFATNFNSGNDIGIVGYNSNFQVPATSTINGVGLAYDTANQTSNYFMSSFTMSNTNTVSFTISIYPRNTSNIPSFPFFANRGYPGNATEFTYAGTTGNTLGYSWNSEPGTYNYNSGVFLMSNVWQHVALVISPSNAKFYKNGSLCNTYTYTHIPMSFPRWDIAQDSGLVPLIGTRRQFPGFIDNIRVYNRSLTDGEVSTIYQNTTTGIVVPDYLWAQMFTTASNGFVNYNVANLIANTPSGIGTSYRTTGQGDLYIPTLFTATNTVSFCASVFMSNNTTTYPGIIVSRDYGAPASGLNIKDTGTQIGYLWNDVGNTYSYNTGIFLTLNTWTHIVLRITSSNAQWYINGNLSNTFVNSHGTATFTRMYVGTDTYVSGRNFPGYIDNCRFYTRALSPSEITSIYQNTLVV